MGKVSEYLRLLTKLQEDIGTIIKLTPNGYLNELSLASWISKNDSRCILKNYTSTNTIGSTISTVEHHKYFLRQRSHSDILVCPSTVYEDLPYTGEHVVSQILHELLWDLRTEEYKHYKSVDPLNLAYIRLKEVVGHASPFDFAPLNALLLNGTDCASEYNITVEDIERWIEAHQKVNAYVAKLSKTYMKI